MKRGLVVPCVVVVRLIVALLPNDCLVTECRFGRTTTCGVVVLLWSSTHSHPAPRKPLWRPKIVFYTTRRCVAVLPHNHVWKTSLFRRDVIGTSALVCPAEFELWLVAVTQCRAMKHGRSTNNRFDRIAGVSLASAGAFPRSIPGPGPGPCRGEVGGSEGGGSPRPPPPKQRQALGEVRVPLGTASQPSRTALFS